MPNPNPDQPNPKGTFRERTIWFGSMEVRLKDDCIVFSGHSLTPIDAVSLRNQITNWINTKKARDNGYGRGAGKGIVSAVPESWTQGSPDEPDQRESKR